VGPTYFTKLPPEVNVFHIGEFLDRLDNIFTEEQHDKMRDENFIPPLKEEWVDECGEQAFGDNWGKVKEQIIVSEENLDAHPFLFELEVKEERRFPGSRRPRQISKKQLYYPRYFSRLLRLQIFPMLENGDEPSGHDLLSDITGERGKEYERNLYNYLSGKGIECYHSAELTRNEPYEIDLLLALDDRLLFIELKYLLPPIRINEPKGIRILDEKFNLEIFNEEPEDRHRTADGNPYPEKVDAWTGLEPGAQFTSQVGPDEDDTEKHEVPEGWDDLEIEKYVVSNVVPSYIEKQGVRFMTDLEFYQWIEHGDDSVLYSAP
jgi:hypothetical protein